MTGSSPDGELPALVLLPGLDGTGELFEPLLTRLDSSIKTVVVRYPLDEPLGYEWLTSIARRELPATGTYVILGESFSGPIAAQLAAERSPRLVGVVLCASFVSTPMAHLQPFEWILDAAPVRSFAQWFGPTALFGRFQTRELRALLLRALARVPRRILIARIRAVLSANAVGPFARADVPKVYLQATEDTLVPPSSVDEICRLDPKTRVMKLVAPHGILQCVPNDAGRMLREFVHSLSNRQTPAST
jgi:pimeloyl-ACP methyl ester carboxylesterase